MASQRKIIIITAPSGAGKTSITHYLLKTISKLAFSVSATTRKQRKYEKDKIDYFTRRISEKNSKRRVCRMGNGL
jgi:guanylate kinase